MSLIQLREDSPFRFLNDAFPNGVPVGSTLLSINGCDCYEFKPDHLPYSWCLDLLGRAIVSAPHAPLLQYGLFAYGIVPIPLEWTEDTRLPPMRSSSSSPSAPSIN